MDSVSANSAAPGLAQVYMLRKTLDLAQSNMANLLSVLPPTAPISATGRLDTYA